jgi:hypothetical protein
MNRARILPWSGQQPSEAKRTVTRSAVVLAVIVFAMSVLGGASAAHAVTVTTSYYTINVAAPTPSSSVLFLAPRDGYSVTLNRYISGDLSAHWTPRNPEYPFSSPVTGTSPLSEFGSGILGCLRQLFLKLEGCPFHGHAGGPPVKLVNQVSGKCLTTGHPWRGNGTKVHQLPCVPGKRPGFSDQLWTLARGQGGNVIPAGETAIVQTQDSFSRCLDATDRRNVIGTPMQAWSCQSTNPWNQRFRFLGVEQDTCQVVVPNDPCGLVGTPTGKPKK